MSCALLHCVDEHFAGQLAPEDEHALRRHLPHCAACLARYERQLLLERLSPRRLGPKPRLARALGLRPRQHVALPAGLAFAGVAAVALIFMLRPPVSPDFRARGSAPKVSVVNAELQIFRIASDGRPEAVSDSIAPHDELGFRYRNPTGKRRLMIFARDGHEHFYWYQPAWLRAADDPIATPIGSDGETHELGEVVAHEFDTDRIVLFALYTDEPLSARTIEALARKQPLDRLTIPGAVVVTMPLFVRR